jgi:hypothetical protein
MATVTRAALTALQYAATHANLWAHGSGYTFPFNPDFSYHVCEVTAIPDTLIPPYSFPPAVPPPVVNWADWDGVSTIDTFLNTVDTEGGWTASPVPYPYGGYATRPEIEATWGNGFYLCHIPGWLLPLASGRMYSAQINRTTPPVWPGFGFATLGSPVALAPTLTITEPMDGVIITLTTIPPRLGSYNFGDARSYVNAGRVAFVDDNGSAEWPLPFSFPQHVISPRNMVRAAACYVSTASGIAGTVTPWVIVL